jgi:hypothetical protein
MGIIPRANPNNLPQLNNLPQARNQTEVRPYTGGAEALGDLAGIATQYYQKEKKRNDVTAVMQARRELSDLETQTFDPANPDGISKYKGINALGANEAIVPKIDSKISEIRMRMSRDQQEMFDGVAMNYRDGVTARLNSYMGKEHEEALGQEQKATLTNLSNDAFSSVLRGDPPDVTANKLAEVVAVGDAVADANGYPPAVKDANRRSLVSGHHQEVLTHLVGTDYTKAEDYLSAHRNEMLPEAVVRVEAQLRPIAEAGENESIAGSIVDGGTLQTNAVGQVSTRSANDPVSIQKDFRAIAEKNGTIITSMQRGVIAKGAGIHSQHPKGTAADFRTRDKTPEQVNQLMADLRSAGFEVIDERGNKDGPHIHAELPPQGSRAGAPATMLPAQSLGEALDRVRSMEPDVRRRKAIESEVRSRWAVREADKVDAERTALERMRTSVGSSTGGFRQSLGADYAEAEKQGWLPGLKAIWNEKRTGQLIDTDPLVYDRFARLAVSDPKAFASKATVVDLWKHAGELSTADLSRLQGAWKEMQDPKKAEGARNYRNVEAALIDEGLLKLGWDGSRPADKQKAAVFGLAVSQSRDAFRAMNPGKDITPEQDRILVGQVVQRFAKDPDKALDTARKLSDARLSISVNDRKVATAALRRLGYTNPDEFMILRAAEQMKQGAPK